LAILVFCVNGAALGKPATAGKLQLNLPDIAVSRSLVQRLSRPFRAAQANAR
jgi:hypothetical protein